MSLARIVTPALLLGWLASVVARPAAAQPAVDQPSCRSSRDSLSFVACRLVEQLALAGADVSITVAELKSDRELPAANAAALRERVREAVSRALSVGGAPAKKGELRRLKVELSIEKSGGVLRVSANAWRGMGLWQRLRRVKAVPERHAFAEAPLDAELRALVPPPPLVVGELLKLKAPERGIVAMACGPLAPDGGQELALVSRANVRVGRIVGHAFAERKKIAWSALSSVSPAPLREPIASAEITPEGALRVGLSDRRDGLELSRELAVVARFAGLMPVPGGRCVERSGLGLVARFDGCTVTASGRSAAATLDAVAGFADTQLGRDSSNSKLSGARAELAQSSGHVGAQLALGDADSDGNPELAYSADTLEPSKDRLTLVTLDGQKLTPRFVLPAPGISAVAICARREGPGMAPLVVASGDELWLIR